MALFEYFPNYVWNLSLSIAMQSGAELGEIIDMSKPLLEKAQKGEDAQVEPTRQQARDRPGTDARQDEQRRDDADQLVPVPPDHTRPVEGHGSSPHVFGRVWRGMAGGGEGSEW